MINKMYHIVHSVSLLLVRSIVEADLFCFVLLYVAAVVVVVLLSLADDHRRSIVVAALIVCLCPRFFVY